ncbi:MAG: hypothetical protein M1812_004802 [Candelaria pacifica]|nr:MAG: hypothetical protein M1812_004802 [Candelaria pacifica]
MEASEWWANVIKATFQPFSTSLPDRLIPDLLKRFSSSEGYRLDPSVASLFDMIREANVQSRTDGKKPWPWDYTVVGIITNSDDRIPSILSSLGLKVGGKRYGAANEQAEDACKDNDISFLVLSYDVGVEKPDAKIFDAAKELLKTSLGGDNQNCRTVGSRAPIEEKHRVDEFELLHVGDDEKQDVLGALNAGWNSVLLDRNGRHSRNFREEEGKYISSVELASAPRRVKVIQDLKALRFWRAP